MRSPLAAESSASRGRYFLLIGQLVLVIAKTTIRPPHPRDHLGLRDRAVAIAVEVEVEVEVEPPENHLRRQLVRRDPPVSVPVEFGEASFDPFRNALLTRLPLGTVLSGGDAASGREARGDTGDGR